MDAVVVTKEYLFCVPAPPYDAKTLCMWLFIGTFLVDSLLIWRWYTTPQNSVMMERFQQVLVHISGCVWVCTLFSLLPTYVGMATTVLMPFNTFAFGVFLARYAATWRTRIVGDLDGDLRK